MSLPKSVLFIEASVLVVVATAASCIIPVMFLMYIPPLGVLLAMTHVVVILQIWSLSYRTYSRLIYQFDLGFWVTLVVVLAEIIVTVGGALEDGEAIPGLELFAMAVIVFISSHFVMIQRDARDHKHLKK